MAGSNFVVAPQFTFFYLDSLFFLHTGERIVFTYFITVLPGSTGLPFASLAAMLTV